MWARFIISALIVYTLKVATCHDNCETKSTCRECIREHYKCVWCTAANITTPRCKSLDSATSTCNKDDIENPQGVYYDNRLNSNDTLGQYQQLLPTKADIWLRPGDAKKFTFQFKPAKDYPLDLYFLIDFSLSMNETVAKTAQQDISNGLRDLTNNVYLGLGSFIDKRTVPYISKVNHTSYSFKHHLNLTSNATLFSSAINNSTLGSNYDAKEGGLDALAQVLACKEKIGWRNDSRKIVIFLSDESCHLAGDGKWAGIFTPYDGQCYMENNQYTKELDMDYPSISQINKLINENQVTIFFAVLGGPTVYNEYIVLKNAINGSLCGRFQDNSQEFVDQIHDMYKNLSQFLSMQINIDDADHNHIDIKIDPDCLGDSSDNPECKILSHNRDVKNFTVKILLKDYYGVDKTSFSISPQGFREKLDVNIHVINECKCEAKGDKNAAICNKHGMYQCGLCQCDLDRYGSNCQCTGTYDNNGNSTCIAKNSKSLCSGGRGACKCGRCECYTGYEGEFCEFTKDDCPGKTPEGPCSMHGACHSGTCTCREGWSGEKCDCPTSTELCRRLGDKVTSDSKECSGLGDCLCGKCKCRKMASWDSRGQNSEYCYFERCPECHERQCQALEACALCQNKNVDSNETCLQICHSDFIISKTKEMSNYTDPWRICDLSTDIGCFTTFAYRYEGADKLELHVNTENNCVESYYLFGLSTLGIVLLVGLLTLCAWKVLTTLRDRRDYQAFKREYDAAEWIDGKNPLYESPNTTFHNPAFEKS